MAEELEKLGFGFIDDNDESLQTSGGTFNFGLNTGTLSIKFEDEDSERDYQRLVFTFTKDGKEQYASIFDGKKVKDKNGNDITDTESPEYIKGYNNNVKQANATVIHLLKAIGVKEEDMKEALKRKKPADFKQWCGTLLPLVSKGYDKKPVDIFFQYQWNIKEGQNRTWAEFPANMKGGHFACPHVEPKGSWHEEREWVETDAEGNEKTKKGLRFVDDEGNVHPIIKSEGFMSSNRGTMQTTEATNVNTAVVGGFGQGNSANVQGSEEKSYW